MRYKEYVVRESGKRLGLLGETHLYNNEESSFARSIVPKYKTVAIEGGEDDLFIRLVRLLYLPAFYAFKLGDKRTAVDTEQISMEHYARIVDLGGNEFNILQKCMIATIGMISIPLSPFLYLEFFLERKKGRRIEDFSPNSLSCKVIDYAFNGKGRDAIMGTRAVNFLDDTDSLLAVFGQAHFKGIDNYFNKVLALEKKTEFQI